MSSSSPTRTVPALPPIYVALGAAIRDAREDAGRTQEQVARAAGLTRTSLTNIERGRQKLLVDTLVSIAAFLDKTGSSLLSEIETKMDSKAPSSLKIPADLPKNVTAQIEGMIAPISDTITTHAKPQKKLHSREGSKPPRRK